MADQLLPLSIVLRATDAAGTPLPNGSVLFVRAGTLDRVAVYQDRELTSLLTNPVLADATGTIPAVWFGDEFEVDAYVYNASGALVRSLSGVLRTGTVPREADDVAFTARDNLPANDVDAALRWLADTLETEREGPRSVATGGTGGRNEEEARAGLGLGTVATYDVDTSTNFATQTGRIPTRGAVASYVGGRFSSNSDWTEDTGDAPTRAAVVTYLDGRTNGTTDFTDQGSDWPTRTAVRNYLSSRTSSDADFTQDTALLPTRASVASYVSGRVDDTSDFDTAGTKLPTRSAVKDYVSSRIYTSSERTITTGGSLTLSHSLGAVPLFIQFWLVCQTGEHGYSAGDRIAVDMNSSTPSESRHNTARVTSTQIIIRFSNDAECFSAADATVGDTIPLTNANWRLVVTAFR